jgi:hypothetical protein
MKNLPPAVLRILTELRYILPDGATQPISNAALAARTGIGEGFVSAAVRWLAGEAIAYYPQLRVAPAHAFITRQPRSDGQPGYEITMLPPPELRQRTTVKERALFLGDHGCDPLPQTAPNAAGRAETPQQGDHAHDPLLLFMHAESESTNRTPPPNDLPGGGGALSVESRAESNRGADQLAPPIVSGHQALNPDRPILTGEWHELLTLQHTHGEAALLVWQARAARVVRLDVARITPAYYRACAAQEACTSYRPPCHQRPPEPPTEPPAPPIRPRPTLDPACDALLTAMGMREREKLAGVPLALIERWQTVLDHEGLAARFVDVRAFAHAQMRKGNVPPARTELERWAKGIPARGVAHLPAPLSPADEQQRAQREAQIQARAAQIAPPDLTDDERLALLADLEQGCCDGEARSRLVARREGVGASNEPLPLLTELRLSLSRRHWALLGRITLETDAHETRLICSLADRGLVEAHLLPVARAQGGPRQVRLVTRGAEVVVVPVVEEPTRPEWIAPEAWAALPALMRTALTGATLVDGSVRCATVAFHRLLTSRYGRELVGLLALAAAPQRSGAN